MAGFFKKAWDWTGNIPGSPDNLHEADKVGRWGVNDLYGKERSSGDVLGGGNQLSKSPRARDAGRAIGTLFALWGAGAAAGAGAGGEVAADTGGGGLLGFGGEEAATSPYVFEEAGMSAPKALKPVSTVPAWQRYAKMGMQAQGGMGGGGGGAWSRPNSSPAAPDPYGLAASGLPMDMWAPQRQEEEARRKAIISALISQLQQPGNENASQ